MNKYLLKEMCCPNPDCESEGPFDIIVIALAEVDDESIGYYTSPQWDNESFCRCQKCLYGATVGDFIYIREEQS